MDLYELGKFIKLASIYDGLQFDANLNKDLHRADLNIGLIGLKQTFGPWWRYALS